MVEAEKVVRKEKDRIRHDVWTRLESEGLAGFPRPVTGRIPNFKDAEKAAARLVQLREFKRARTIKINPDAPQRMIRFHALKQGKIVLTPTPRLREGFILLDPGKIPSSSHLRAASIGGAAALGQKIPLTKLPKIDLIVMGAVAVSKDGSRLGKGEGYGELEYATLRELRLIDARVPIVTTVHDIQVFPNLPRENHNVPVDIIVTPSLTIRTRTKHEKPSVIFWEKLSDERINEMPVLRELKKIIRRKE